ncbi:MAG: IPTL-CTERM sorting domain-containing protein [Xanthomonadales bacterium]|nr:IPTL-CTERM sorting domain-containing protein [Xanthomonadales bacterium]
MQGIGRTPMNAGKRKATETRFSATKVLNAALMGLAVLLPSLVWAGVDNVQAEYAGAEAGDWGGKKGAVIGPPDDTCANMGAVGKINLISNFGFTIPGGATITGVEAFIKAGSQGGQDVSVQLASNATVDPPTTVGIARNIPTPDPGSGNCADTTFASVNGTLAGWGLGPGDLTPAIVNNNAFGVVFEKIVTAEVKVDAVCLEIFHDGGGSVLACDEPPPPPEGNVINVVKDLEPDGVTPPASAWDFSGELGGFSIAAGGGVEQFTGVTNDTYTITETTKAGFTASVECYQADVLVASGSSSVDLTVAGGLTYTCIFTNTGPPPPPPPPPEVIPVPTLSEWMLALLAMLTLGVGLYAGRARRGQR